jgi:hypothetical protein
MPTKDRKDINAEVLSLKQASMSRAVSAARVAFSAGGILRTRIRSDKVPYTQELRVKSA